MQEQEEMLELELQVGAAKVSKYAVRESGDTLEMIERPHGGLSLVLVDGQQSGQSAKRISNLVARKAISLLAEGVRDGAAARATHDYLRTYRQGQVSAELSMVSLDLATRSLVISRNSHCPVLLLDKAGWQTLDEPTQPIGIYAGTKPSITEIPIAANIWVIAFTDGVLHAGRRFGMSFDALSYAAPLVKQDQCTAPILADALLAHAIELDHGRPQDDMSVLVLALVPMKTVDNIRRLSVRFPLPPF